MLKSRDNTYRYIMVLGALFFLFASSSTQACVLGDHDGASSTQVIAPAHINGHHAFNHSSQNSHHETQDKCCHLISADLSNFANAQVSNPSASQLSSNWFHLHFASLSSLHYIGFAQREIFSPPPEFSSVFHTPAVSSLNAGRAPPSAVLA